MAKANTAAAAKRPEAEIKITRKYSGEKSAQDVLIELIRAHSDKR